MTKVRSGFTWYIRDGVIIVEDLGTGCTSVTNDIENVVTRIGEEEHIDPKNYLFIYKDSEDFWDGYNTKANRFIVLHATTRSEAISLLKFKNEML